MNFKYPLPAGQLLEYWKGRLYVAADNLLYIGDPYSDYYDGRRFPKKFNGTITLIRGVQDGIYIADGKTHFMKGESPLEFEMINNIIDADAIMFTDQLILGQYISQKIDLEYAIWTSTKGVCVGDPQGNASVINDRYKMTYTRYRRGASMIHKIDGKEQYVGVLTI